MRNNSPAPFNNIRARSFHKILTTNHRDIPIIDNTKSNNAMPSTPRSDIAPSTNILATHLIYQSKVYFGVADLNIRLLFSSSALLISFFLVTEYFLPILLIFTVFLRASFTTFPHISYSLNSVGIYGHFFQLYIPYTI